MDKKLQSIFSLLLKRKKEFSKIVKESSSKEEIADKINQLNIETLKNIEKSHETPKII